MDEALNEVVQEAYRIQVSTTQNFQNTIWDSGKIHSDQSTHVTYNGPALASKTPYYWRVKIWDNKSRESNWSDAAFWEMAMLLPLRLILY